VGQEIPRPLYLITDRLRGQINTLSFRGETALLCFSLFCFVLFFFFFFF
jgi:hypothetical protein